MFRHELKATVPRRILECSAVSREINFSSKEEIRRFRLEQRVFLEGACIEGEGLVFCVALSPEDIYSHFLIHSHLRGFSLSALIPDSPARQLSRGY